MAINDPNSLQPVDNRRVVPQPGTTDATSAAEKPTAIFVNMTAAQADEYGLTDEYKKANTDGEDGITQEEYDYYQAHKNDPPEASEEAEATETDTTSGTDATEKNYNLFDGSKTVTSSTGASSSVWTGSADTARTATNPVVLTNPSIAASVSTDLYSQYTAQTKGQATTATTSETETETTETDSTKSGQECSTKTKTKKEQSYSERLEQFALRPNMTKADIEAIENERARTDLLKLFDDYDTIDENGNSKKDGILSWKEFEMYANGVYGASADNLIKFERKIEEYMNTHHCTRTEAIKIINEEKITTELSKQEGVLDRLKYDPSKIDVSKAEALTKEDLDKMKERMDSLERIHAGMTREQAKEIGGKTLELFNQICPEGKDQIELIDILKYAAGADKKTKDNIITARIVKTLESQDSATRLQMEKQIFTAMYGSAMTEADVENSNSGITEAAYNFLSNLDNEYGTYSDKLAAGLCDHMDQEKYRNAKTQEEKNKILGEGLRQVLRDDLDIRNELSNRITAILNNEDKYVKSLGIKNPLDLSQEELERLAIESTINEYVKTIQLMLESMAEDVSNEQDPEKKKAKNSELSALIQSLKTSFSDVPQIRQLLEVITIESVQDEQCKQKLVEDSINNNDLTVNGGEILDVAKTSLVMYEGSTDTIEEFFQQNAEHIEDIQFIAKDIVASMPESPKKDSFAEFINNAIEEIIIQNNSGSSSYDNHSTTSGNGSGQGSSSAVQQTMYSLLQWNAQQNNAPKFSLDNLAPQNPIFQNDNSVTDVTEASGSRADQSSINHAAFRISKEYKDALQLRYAQARVQNMSKTKMFELVAKNFDRIPDQYKEDVINYFKQMPTQLLVETAIENDAVKDFMFEHKFIKMEDIVNYVRKHPQLMEKGNKQISDSLKEQLKDFAKEQKLDDIHV